jgi:hypothetical protein
MQQSRSLGSPATVILPVATAAAAIAIFVADNETGNEVAVAVLYAVVVLMAARFLSTRGITFVAAGVCGLDGGELRTFAVDRPATRNRQHID